MAQQVFEGTAAEIVGLIGRLSSGKRYRVVELEEPEAIAEPKETTPVIDAKNAAAIAYFERRLKEEATDDPEEIRKAEEELAEFKRNMNANRESTGERLVYP